MYELTQSLQIPDGVTIMGEGVMQFDQDGLPLGFTPASRTVLKATATLSGDVLTMGDGAFVQGLTLEDAVGRLGNVVVISSRASGDAVAASIERCEIINPNAAGVAPNGPRGRAIVVITRNLNLGFDPPPHDDSDLSLNMKESLVRSPGGGSGIFAINFSSRSRVVVSLRGNVIGGGVDAAAGTSRPDMVAGSSTTIQSFNNLYRSDSLAPTGTGWQLTGGTDAPVPAIVAGAAIGNRMRVKSVGDRIEGFWTGITATAGRRNSATAGSSSMNEVNINAVGLSFATIETDLMLFGERSFAPGVPAGNENTLRLTLSDATGSGIRNNLYLHSSTLLGLGNELEVVGSLRAFEERNSNIIPPPPIEVFTNSN